VDLGVFLILLFDLQGERSEIVIEDDCLSSDSPADERPILAMR
jgi:hypothetical protein